MVLGRTRTADRSLIRRATSSLARRAERVMVIWQGESLVVRVHAKNAQHFPSVTQQQSSRLIGERLVVQLHPDGL
jgi:hypothetical protein